MSAYVSLPPMGTEPPELPPVLSPSPLGHRAGWLRRAGMLLILTGYLLAILLRHPEQVDGPVLPAGTGEMLQMLGMDLGFFGVVMLVACWVGRPRRTDLYASHGPTPLRWFLGFIWSVALRFGLGFALAGIGMILQLLQGRPGPLDLERFQPKIENLLPVAALKNPVYLLAVCTVVSFVVAGLREELWRAGMIFALSSLLPVSWAKRRREVLAVVFAALVFGAGHLVQGAGGMVLTGLLGLLLGLIMVLRASIWEAVLAHGFFDAATFLMLRVLLDRSLMEDWLIRAGIPPETYRPLLDELGKRFGQ